MKIRKRLIDITGPREIIQRRIPFLNLDSGKPGPVVSLTACIHGDEVGGTVIVHDLFKALLRKGLHVGAIHALPLVNSLGFENMSRYVNSEREDLNRCFPGASDGSMGEQIAHRLFDAIVKTKPSLVIDLHNDWIHSVPYILIEPSGLYASQDTETATLDLARAAKLPLVEDTDDNPEILNTLTAAMIGAGIPAFMACVNHPTRIATMPEATRYFTIPIGRFARAAGWYVSPFRPAIR
jgi:predicted deacylase